MNKNAILFVAHNDSDFVKKQFNKLNDEINHDEYDLWLLYNGTNTSIKANNIYYFNSNVIKRHGFEMHHYYPYRHIQDEDFYGHNFEYSFISFYMDHNNYNFYWLIEYDVYFNINSNEVFQFYDKNRLDVDFYSTHIAHKDINVETEWWRVLGKLIFGIELEDAKKIHSFNPIDRFSNKALHLLAEYYKNGAYGFYEVTMPSIFYKEKLNIKSFGKTDILEFLDDFSDHNEFITDKSDCCGMNYTKSNMTEQKVYHPVKKYIK